MKMSFEYQSVERPADSATEVQIAQIAGRFPFEVYHYVVDDLRYLAERGYDLGRLQYCSGSIQGLFELEVYDADGRQIL